MGIVDGLYPYELKIKGNLRQKIEAESRLKNRAYPRIRKTFSSADHGLIFKLKNRYLQVVWV